MKIGRYIEILKSKYTWIVAGVAILLFYYVFDPMKYTWVPQCIFHKLTGLQCMGCGSQRMLHALLHGDIKGAWEANAFILIMLPFLVFLIFVEFKRKRYPGLYRHIHSLWVIVTISTLLLAWLIVRNLIGT